jgi:hypothetical protein
MALRRDGYRDSCGFHCEWAVLCESRVGGMTLRYAFDRGLLVFVEISCYTCMSSRESLCSYVMCACRDPVFSVSVFVTGSDRDIAWMFRGEVRRARHFDLGDNIGGT